MDETRSWTTLTPVDGSVGGWLAGGVAGRDFSRVAGFVGRSWPAYAVVHLAPHDDFDGSTTDEDLPVDEVTAALRDVLGRHTTSESFVSGIWEGCGYFGGGYRSIGAPPDTDPPGPGWAEVPSDFGPAAMKARRMQLPHREHVLFDAVLDDLRDLPLARGSNGSEVPSLFWPDDRAWLTACDVDLWVVMVGGSDDLVADLLADDLLRVERVTADDRTKPPWVPYGERY